MKTIFALLLATLSTMTFAAGLECYGIYLYGEKIVISIPLGAKADDLITLHYNMQLLPFP